MTFELSTQVKILALVALVLAAGAVGMLDAPGQLEVRDRRGSGDASCKGSRHRQAAAPPRPSTRPWQ